MIHERRDAETRSEGKSCERGTTLPAQAHRATGERPTAIAPMTALLASASLRLCVFFIFMGSASFAAGSFRGVAAPSGEVVQPVPPETDTRVRFGFLADGLTPEQGNWLANGISVAAVIVAIIVGIKKLSGDREAQQRSMVEQVRESMSAEHDRQNAARAPQPFMVAHQKDFATQQQLTELAMKTETEIKRLSEAIIPRKELLARLAQIDSDLRGVGTQMHEAAEKLSRAGEDRLAHITNRLDRIAETAGANAAAFAQFQRDLPTLIKHAK